MKSELEEYNDFMNGYADFMIDDPDGEHFDSFYKYGPLTNQYWNFTPRILVCNIEPYDEREDIIEVNIDFFKEHWMKQTASYKAQTPRKTAKFIAALINTINRTEIESIDFNIFDENELITSLEKIAYLNFRANSGCHVSANKNDSLTEQIKVTGEYIKDQIKLLNPQIIIIGGVKGCEVFNLLYKDCNLLFREIKKWNNKIVCSTTHFSRIKYEDSKDALHKIIKLLNIN